MNLILMCDWMFLYFFQYYWILIWESVKLLRNISILLRLAFKVYLTELELCLIWGLFGPNTAARHFLVFYPIITKSSNLGWWAGIILGPVCASGWFLLGWFFQLSLAVLSHLWSHVIAHVMICTQLETWRARPKFSGVHSPRGSLLSSTLPGEL